MTDPDIDCVFCGIVAGVVESSRVYEDEQLLAFMDIRPLTRGHLLVIPKMHAPCLAAWTRNSGPPCSASPSALREPFAGPISRATA